MSDASIPAAATALVVSTSASAGVAILGVQTGLDYPTMIAGFVGGATALSYLDPCSAKRQVFDVISATLVAGYCSPMLASIVVPLLKQLPIVGAEVAREPIQICAGLMVGYLCHGVFLPGVRKLGEAFVRRNSQ